MYYVIIQNVWIGIALLECVSLSMSDNTPSNLMNPPAANRTDSAPNETETQKGISQLNVTEQTTVVFRKASGLTNTKPTKGVNAVKRYSTKLFKKASDSVTTMSSTAYNMSFFNATNSSSEYRNVSTETGPAAKTFPIKPKHVSYIIHKQISEEEEKKRNILPFSHHLHLVPVEDEPFGNVIWKDERYLVSVLIPIGIGVGGAAIIVCTTYGLRWYARRKQMIERRNLERQGPSISHVSSSKSDQIVLLGDTTDDEF